MSLTIGQGRATYGYENHGVASLCWVTLGTTSAIEQSRSNSEYVEVAILALLEPPFAFTAAADSRALATFSCLALCEARLRS